ncbi:multidrug ABC transporter ATPase [Saccharothrix sp. NRRL B-16348]|uniref:ABC transporter ATP-binding protein n=1 Tax=Saccharothrix sp. NRRL B-16348 TaxID=1415542 RepID=UPI0006B02803|nr:ABC transporter ATP-binding protein [Saccharothrix sp. NRRL B-16348]KOX30110.1 multidrug ABC transporter ATPase [Saccharothrix sp. NRRL B-16348]
MTAVGPGRAARAVGRLRDRGEVRFFEVLGRAAPGLAGVWFGLLVVRAVLPVAFVLSMSGVVAAVLGGEGVAGRLVVLGVVFIAMHVTPPLYAEVGLNLGDRTADWLNQRLMATTTRPEGIAHLERSDHASQLVRARDFDLALSGPPMSVAMGFIASGLVQLASGIGMCALLFGYHWWVPPLLGGAWGATHWLMRDSAVWRGRLSDEATSAQREAEYRYRVAVDAPAAKEIRIFGLADWLVESFATQRRLLMRLRLEATRLDRRGLGWSLLVLTAAHVPVFVVLAGDITGNRVGLAQAMVFVLAAIGASGIAFGGLNSALSMCGQVVDSVFALERDMAPDGDLPSGTRSADGLPAHEIRFRDVHFGYGPDGQDVLRGLDLVIPAGKAVAVVGLNGAGKTTIAKLLARLYDPDRGAVEVDGIDLREFDIADWRRRLSVIYQDFVRFEASLRDNVSPAGAPEEFITEALATAGAAGVADLDAVLGRGYDDSTELSGGQWQRVAIARALCAVRMGAGVVVLDEPTAQIDVRAELELFNRLLAATESCTRVLVSHRFATVRKADLIHVVEHGRVVESGTHDELMAAGGRYRTMFDLQAARFDEEQDVPTQ